MSMFSEIIAEANIAAICKIRDKYLADPTISEEAKAVLTRASAEMVDEVAD